MSTFSLGGTTCIAADEIEERAFARQHNPALIVLVKVSGGNQPTG